MAQKPLVYKQIQHAAKHYNAHNGVLKAAADAAGMAESTFRRQSQLRQAQSSQAVQDIRGFPWRASAGYACAYA